MKLSILVGEMKNLHHIQGVPVPKDVLFELVSGVFAQKLVPKTKFLSYSI